MGHLRVGHAFLCASARSTREARRIFQDANDAGRHFARSQQAERVGRVGGESYALAAGDVVMFRGDQRHAYTNTAGSETIAYSVIAFAPSGT
jgi:hypothetical protein